MQIQVTEETHCSVAWEGRTPLLYIEIGLLVALVISIAFVAPSAHPWRWWIIIAVLSLCMVLAAFLGNATPLSEHVHVERTPEGGTVRREQHWVFKGELVAWESPLDAISTFWVEEQAFEETGRRVVTMARLWVRLADQEDSMPLTDWSQVEVIRSLAESVAQATRLPLDSAA